jgi:SAM-dependent methyltransferase
MTSFVAPDAGFVFLHLPHAGGTWFTENVAQQTKIIPFGEGNHGCLKDMPPELHGFPRISIARSPVGWVECYFNYSDRNGWNDSDPMSRSCRSVDCDEFVIAIMKKHPYIMRDFFSGFIDESEIVIDFDDLVCSGGVALKEFGLRVVDKTKINHSPRAQSMTPGVARAWMIHNADLAERFGWDLPDEPIYSLQDWSGWFWRACQWLALRFAGRPCRFLEIGVCEGRSAAIAAKTILKHADSQYVGVDCWLLNPRRRAEANILRSISASRMKLYDAWYQLTTMDDSRSFDVIYVDGDHAFDGCISDLRRSVGRLAPGGYLIVDDCGCEAVPSSYPGVNRAVEVFLGQMESGEVIRLDEFKIPGCEYQRFFRRPV